MGCCWVNAAFTIPTIFAKLFPYARLRFFTLNCSGLDANFVRKSSNKSVLRSLGRLRRIDNASMVSGSFLKNSLNIIR